MPITRTVNGLKYEWALDSLDEGSTWNNNGTQWLADTDERHEGAASIKGYGEVGPGIAYFSLAIPAADIATGYRLHVWHKSTDANHTWYCKIMCIGAGACCPQGSIPYWTTTIVQKTGTEGWTLKKADIPSCIAPNGSQRYLHPSVLTTQNYETIADWTDRVVISTTKYLTMTGLNPGQLVEVYRSTDDMKITEGTCAAGETQVVVDIDAEDYPEYMYLKVYATDGVTLVEKTANKRICGGDTWQWNPPLGTMDIKSDAYTIYRTGSAGSPTSTIVTATLRTPAGAPYPNVTVYFTASKGTLSVASDITDVNGEAHTSLSSDLHGIAVVSAYWPGDDSVPAAVAYATHHALHDLEVGDLNKNFQFFIEGIEYSYATGRYVLSNESDPQEWSAEIPEWQSTITRRGLVSIYRRGIKEFSGILTVIDRALADSPRIILSGVDSKSLLDTRDVTIKDYSDKSVAFMFDDLLASFWCGLTIGTISDYPGVLTQTFADESLGSSIARLCDYIGWQYRVTLANKVDCKPSFGALVPSVEFVQGRNLFLNSYRIDDRQVCNSVRMRGNENLVSTVFDGTSIMGDDLGLLEEVVFQKSIGTQDMLDIAANAELARKAGQNIAIQTEVKDDYAPGTWSVDDSVTLSAPEHQLSDIYKVVRIERDMTDPNWARVDFLNKLSLEWGDLWQSVRRELKDLGAKTAI